MLAPRVKNSKRFGAFDRFFISDTKWASLREEFFAQSGLPQKGCDAATYLSERLNLAYDKFLETLPNNTYAQVDGAGWHLSVDSAEPSDPTEEAKIDQLKSFLKKHQRHIKLPQLLIEVDAEGFVCDSTANELHFTRHFLPLTQNQTRPVDEIVAIIAAVMFASLSSLHKTVNYKRCTLAPLFNRKGRTNIKMDWIVDQWDRMRDHYKTGAKLQSLDRNHKMLSLKSPNQFTECGDQNSLQAPILKWSRSRMVGFQFHLDKEKLTVVVQEEGKDKPHKIIEVI